MTHSPSLFDAPGTEACTSEQRWNTNTNTTKQRVIRQLAYEWKIVNIKVNSVFLERDFYFIVI